MRGHALSVSKIKTRNELATSLLGEISLIGIQKQCAITFVSVRVSSCTALPYSASQCVSIQGSPHLEHI